jgi:hypothetical protein
MTIKWEPRPSGDPARLVTDATTMKRWRVWARPASHMPRVRDQDCLVFDGGDVVRRVWPVPADWGSLPDDALLALVARPPREVSG